jgi:hypothetical protein
VSREPTAKPRIVHNFLATQRDRDLTIAGVRICLQIAAQPALKAVYSGPCSCAATSTRRW